MSRRNMANWLKLINKNEYITSIFNVKFEDGVIYLLPKEGRCKTETILLKENSDNKSYILAIIKKIPLIGNFGNVRNNGNNGNVRNGGNISNKIIK